MMKFIKNKKILFIVFSASLFLPILNGYFLYADDMDHNPVKHGQIPKGWTVIEGDILVPELSERGI